MAAVLSLPSQSETASKLFELRSQRALLLSAIREVESAHALVIFRERDELFSYAVTELLLAVRQHVVLEAFVDRLGGAFSEPTSGVHDVLASPEVSALLAHDTDPCHPAEGSTQCPACNGLGRLTTAEDSRTCEECMGVGCIL